MKANFCPPFWHTLLFRYKPTKNILMSFLLTELIYEIRYVPSESDNKCSAVILTGRACLVPYQFLIIDRSKNIPLLR